LHEARQVGGGVHPEQDVHVIGHESAREQVASFLSGDRGKEPPKEARGRSGDRPLAHARGPHKMDVEPMTHDASLHRSRPNLRIDP
jgi:hypothetical protein